MLGKFIARARKFNWDKGAARIGAFGSRHQDAAVFENRATMSGPCGVHRGSIDERLLGQGLIDLC